MSAAGGTRLGDREANPDAWRSSESAADGHGAPVEEVGKCCGVENPGIVLTNEDSRRLRNKR